MLVKNAECFRSFAFMVRVPFIASLLSVGYLKVTLHPEISSESSKKLENIDKSIAFQIGAL
jgi:hypothetical protein